MSYWRSIPSPPPNSSFSFLPCPFSPVSSFPFDFLFFFLFGGKVVSVSSVTQDNHLQPYKKSPCGNALAASWAWRSPCPIRKDASATTPATKSVHTAPNGLHPMCGRVA